MDADGDIDILASASIGDKVVLFKSNGAADPTFTASDIITGFDTPIGLDVADVDFDGDLDIGITGNDGLNSNSSTDIVAWYASDGAANPTWTQIDKTTTLPNGAENVFFADIDGDQELESIPTDPFTLMNLRLQQNLPNIGVNFALGANNVLNAGESQFTVVQPRWFFAKIGGQFPAMEATL